MKKMVSNFKKVCATALPMILAVVGMSALSSCQDNELTVEEKILEEQNAYRENFEALVGKINPNQNWDFSGTDGSTKAGTRALSNNIPEYTVVPAGNDNYWEVPTTLTNYINEILPEAESPKIQLENPTYLTIPNASELSSDSNGKYTVTFYPIYMGLSLVWDLSLVVRDNDGTEKELKFWGKGQNMKGNNENLGVYYVDDKYPGYREYIDGNWQDSSYWRWVEWADGQRGSSSNYRDGFYRLGINQNGKLEFPLNNNTDKIGYATTTLNKTVKTKGYTFTFDLTGTHSDYQGKTLYLKMTQIARNWFWQNASLGAESTSLNRQVKYIPIENSYVGNNFAGKSLTFIGFEDADIKKEGDHYVNSKGEKYYRNNGSGPYVNQNNQNDKLERPGESDYDYNDLVVLMVADKTVINEDTYEYPTVGKRYMVEDLGTTDDIDFNDIVIDMEQSSVVKVTKKTINGVLQADPIRTVISKTQTAKIRAMGGTLDFAIYFGDNTTPVFQKSNSSYNVGTMYNTGWEGQTIDYNNFAETVTLNGNPWNPETNNIKIKVWRKDNTTYEDSFTSPHNTSVTYNNDNSVTISFPNNGEVPYIMAFPIGKQWKDERSTICEHWVKDNSAIGNEPCTESHTTTPGVGTVLSASGYVPGVFGKITDFTITENNITIPANKFPTSQQIKIKFKAKKNGNNPTFSGRLALSGNGNNYTAEWTDPTTSSDNEYVYATFTVSLSSYSSTIGSYNIVFTKTNATGIDWNNVEVYSEK